MFRAGVADFNISFRGYYYAIEAKFIKTAPARDDSLVLKHPLSELQYKHLSEINFTGNIGLVLVGLPDIAVAVPLNLFHNGNIKLKQLKQLSQSSLGCAKIKGRWQIEGTERIDWLESVATLNNYGKQ
jgi:penicillin-binding protein-related factor A (putative recombinase)